jgi:hypothetical protein
MNSSLALGMVRDHYIAVLAALGGVAAAGGRRGGTRLLHRPADGFALDPILVTVIGRLPLDAVDMQIYVNRHCNTPYQ